MYKRLGIVGGGQLGRMMGMAAKQLGFLVTVIDPTPDSPAGQVVDRQIIADYKDEAAIRELASTCDFLTFEIELANADVLDEIAAQGVLVNPSAHTLGIIRDKLKQKEFLRRNGLPVGDFQGVSSIAEVEQAAGQFGYPFLLKARFGAYDGRGNYLIENPEQIAEAWAQLGGHELYVERFVDFSIELAVMVARSLAGEISSYPVVQTIHQDNICHTVLAPAPIDTRVSQQVQNVAREVMEVFGGAGVFGIEMFYTAGGTVLINEIAPRVHNSGHYTVEACYTSQFEQHVRAVAGLPLGDTALRVPAAAMINILGDSASEADVSGLSRALAIPQVSVHIYNKWQTQSQRKMGHITAVGESVGAALKKAEQARQYLSI